MSLKVTTTYFISHDYKMPMKRSVYFVKVTPNESMEMEKDFQFQARLECAELVMLSSSPRSPAGLDELP